MIPKKEVIGNLIMAVSGLILILIAYYYIKEYTTIPDLLKGDQLLTWRFIKWWAVSIVIFSLGFVTTKGKKVFTAIKENWQKNVLKLIAEGLGIIYTGLLVLVFFGQGLNKLFIILGLIPTIFVLFYIANDMRK